MNNKDADERLDIHNLMDTIGLNYLYEIIPIVVQTRPQKSSPSELLWWLSVNK